MASPDLVIEEIGNLVNEGLRERYLGWDDSQSGLIKDCFSNYPITNLPNYQIRESLQLPVD
jgi:hypothetical protein